jgi:phospholipid transport system substrate-binding protein
MLPRRVLLLLAGAFFLALGFSQAAPAAAETPEQFVGVLGEEAIRVLGDAKLTPEQRTEEFRRLLDKGFNMPLIGQLVLGRHWRTATEAQRSEYLKLFEDFIVQTYSVRLGQYNGETFRIAGGRAAPDNTGDTLVTTEIVRPNGPPVRVDWRVRKNGETLKVVDVIAEGISMLITQRDEFAAVIQNSGGKVDALIDRLRRRQL